MTKDEVSAAADRMTFYEAVKLYLEKIKTRSIFVPGYAKQGRS